MHEQQQEARDGKEDAIHDAKGKARLQHGAVLVRVELKGRIAGDAIVVDGEGESTISGEIGAVRIRDVAQLVDAGDESTDEAEIDKGDEEGGVAGGFAAEDGGNGPGSGEDGYDEEDAERICELCFLSTAGGSAARGSHRTESGVRKFWLSN